MNSSASDAPVHPSPTGGRRLSKRLGLGLIDNLVDVASNFPVPFLIAWAGDEAGSEFGAVAVTLLVYNLASGLAGAMGVETYTVLGLADEPTSSRSSEPLMFALLIGTLGLVAAMAILVIGGIATTASILVALAIPGLTYQRQLRLLGHARNVHLTSARNSLLWLIVSTVSLGVAALTAGLTPTSIVVAWLAGGFASLAHYLATWPLARSVRLRRPSVDSRRTGLSLAFEFLVDRGSLDVVGLVLSAAFGSVFAGQLRLGQGIYGLSNRLVGAARPTLLAEGRRRHARQSRGASYRFMIKTSIMLAVVPAVTMLGILLIGEPRFDSSFGIAGVGAFAFAPWLGIRRIGRNLALGPSMFLRVTNELRISRHVRIASGLATIATASALAWFTSPETTLLGLAVSSAVMAVVWWKAALRFLPTADS